MKNIILYSAILLQFLCYFNASGQATYTVTFKVANTSGAYTIPNCTSTNFAATFTCTRPTTVTSVTFTTIQPGSYTFKLYRDATLIDETFTSDQPCDDLNLCGSFTENCPNKITYSKNIANAISGNYKVIVSFNSYDLDIVSSACDFELSGVITNHNSNTVAVDRFDDGYECGCTVPSSYAVSCGSIPTSQRAVNNITVNCGIAATTSCSLVAGTNITMSPGFHANSNSTYHASIDECTTHVNKADILISNEEMVESNSEVLSIDKKEISKTATSLNIYPNPNNGLFTIEYSQEGKINILDVLGKEVYATDLKNNKTEIDLSKFEKGVYFVKITDSTGSTQTKKIIYQ